MRNHKTAIQGSISSFHDLAAKKYFGEEVTVLECNSFKEVCEKIDSNAVDFGVIAIENRVAGSILLNYQLIEKYNLKIIGETYLPIELYLWGKKGVTAKDIKEVISHPMALAQSQAYLSEHGDLKVTEYKDTATCAELILNNPKGDIGVIAGQSTGIQYGLTRLSENLCDVSRNYTRFYILTKQDQYVENADKATVSLRLRNEPGVLLKVLEKIKSVEVNILKIQSIPVEQHSELYSFLLDLTYPDRNKLTSLIQELEKVTEKIKVLGIYKGSDPETELAKLEKENLAYE